MTDQQNAFNQRWQQIDFSNRLADMSLLIRMADELIDAANILEAEVVKYWSEIRLDEHHHPVLSTNRKYVQGAYSLLIAYALENYFKALLIYQNQKDLKGWLIQKLPGYLKHHDLGKLATKYPIPIEPEALANMKKFSRG
jgi:hypothetical protein